MGLDHLVGWLVCLVWSFLGYMSQSKLVKSWIWRVVFFSIWNDLSLEAVGCSCYQPVSHHSVVLSLSSNKTTGKTTTTLWDGLATTLQCTHNCKHNVNNVNRKSCDGSRSRKQRLLCKLMEQNKQKTMKFQEKCDSNVTYNGERQRMVQCKIATLIVWST